MNRTVLAVSRLLVASVLVFVGLLCLGLSSAFAAGGPTVDQSVNGGQSTAFSISTSQPNELILVAAGGWPCLSPEQAVTVDGSPATVVASAGSGGGGCVGLDSGGANVFQFVAPTAGSHAIAIDEGGFCCDYFNNFAVSLLNASSSGITSTSTIDPATPSITTSSNNEYVFASGVNNTGSFGGTQTWSGSPVTPALLQQNSECCGIEASIAGFSAPTAGTYTATLSNTNTFGDQVTILVAVPAGVGAALDALLAAVTGVGPGKSLANKIKQIQSYVNANDTADACAALVGFINEVKAQTGKKITAAQAASFIAQAQAIQATLGC